MTLPISLKFDHINSDSKLKKSQTLSFKDHILVIKNHLTDEYCDYLIERFERDNRKREGIIGRGLDTNTKKSTDLAFSSIPDWENDDEYMCGLIGSVAQEWHDIYGVPFQMVTYSSRFADTGYQIQRTRPGEFYKWHHDFCVRDGNPRILTFIWYLNTIEDKSGGYTEFIDGTKIQPEKGKLIVFPATWTYLHRGFPPTETSPDKYICTGWLHSNLEDVNR
jgi:Rps23 Pro-64 3,4-dihydroxylase Tpa1-like proline 4-hydroxylase